MKFNARQIMSGELAGQWAVFKNRDTYWTSTVRDTREEAEQLAAVRSAEWHLEQALALVKQAGAAVSERAVTNLGLDADSVIDAVTAWRAEHSEHHSEYDPRGWLA